MKNFKILMIFFIMIQLLALASNPLEKYITDEVYKTSLEKFPKKRSIFDEKIYSMDAIKKERAEAINKMKARFLSVAFVSKNVSNQWVTTIYYKNELGTKKRKTIEGRLKMKIGKETYLVIAQSNGIKVKDLKTKYEMELKRKGR